MALVDRFYAARRAPIPVLRPLYPDDLTDARDHLTGFLVQYWGGPTTYSERAGPSAAADAPRPVRHRRGPSATPGIGHMAAAVVAGGLAPDDEAAFLTYFDMAADSLVNRPA